MLKHFWTNAAKSGAQHDIFEARGADSKSLDRAIFTAKIIAACAGKTSAGGQFEHLKNAAFACLTDWSRGTGINRHESTQIPTPKSVSKAQTTKAPKARQALGALTACFLLLGFDASAQGQAQAPAAQQRLSTPRNSASQRYEINQTFDGQAYAKDNNVWVYTQEFADLFGMPAKYVEGVQGIAAAAFRIEDASYQECGYGGRADACNKVEQCLIDLYFDESKTPLPWATDIKSQWVPSYASMRWLRPLDRKERPHGTLAVEPAAGIIRNEALHGQLIPFADPVSKREAIFTTNTWSEGGEDAISGAMGILGYTRDFYRNLSVVKLRFGCSSIARKTINLRLDAKVDVFDTPIARFNRIALTEGFVQRIKDLQKANSDKNAIFYRSLFAPPLGTKGTGNTSSATTNP
ncbi:MAG: hypothetical protein RL710_399 [Pseudomonadota bacterium]|jgi:hypothetical protein